jgi:hypothetical protein
MSYYETQQHMANPQFNPQLWTQFSPQFSQGAGFGLGQAAYGQGLGYNSSWGTQPLGWVQPQRQLSQHDVNDVVRQLLPALPQILSQAQNPFAANPYAGIGHAAYGQIPRQLSQQDVNEVVRQLLPFVPQIVGMVQGQPHQQAAMQSGPFGQFGAPQVYSAFGASTFGGQPQRQLSQQDVADITRQLVGLIPQVIGNLQAANQQRVI